ncbi:MAG TPA: CBS domain-containing protein [Nevskiaceae bacterium]|nr:CBS domain-containing protein [Nevskiaceae bacterium]
MKVSEVMARNPRTIRCGELVQKAAELLAQEDIGGLPVQKDDRLLGMITDRDIVVRVVAGHRKPEETPVEEVVSEGVKYCFEDDDAASVANNMDQLLVRRLPVVNRDKRLVGIVSIEDIRPRANT